MKNLTINHGVGAVESILKSITDVYSSHETAGNMRQSDATSIIEFLHVAAIHEPLEVEMWSVKMLRVQARE